MNGYNDIIIRSYLSVVNNWWIITYWIMSARLYARKLETSFHRWTIIDKWTDWKPCAWSDTPSSCLQQVHVTPSWCLHQAIHQVHHKLFTQRLCDKAIHQVHHELLIINSDEISFESWGAKNNSRYIKHKEYITRTWKKYAKLGKGGCATWSPSLGGGL